MTTLRPTRYSDQPGSTFFEVAGTLVSIRYEAVERSRYLVLRGSPLAGVHVSIDDGAAVLTHEYALPGNRKVGGEIGAIERGLYSFMDEVVRAAMQIRALERTEKDVRALEAEHLYREGSEAQGQLEISDPVGAWRSAEDRVLDELTNRLITAISHVTNVTSLTREGLDAYQGDRNTALERVLESKSATAGLRVQGVLQALSGYLSHDVDPQAEPATVKERALDYLAYVERRRKGDTPTLSDEQAHIIVNEFVPAYMKLKRKHEAAVAFPSNIVENAVGSFFGGGIAGFIVIDLFGESIIEGLTGVSINLPGWWIGAGVEFVRPYLRATYARRVSGEQYERKRQELLERMTRRLQLHWPGEALPPA